MTPAPSSNRNDAGVTESNRGDSREGTSPPTSSQKDFSCIICLDGVEEPVVTQCGHLYCWSCLYQWLEPGMTSNERQALFQKRGRNQALSRPTPSRNNSTSQPNEARRVCPTCKASCSVSTIVPIFVGDVHDKSANEERSQPSSTRNDSDAAASRERSGVEMPSRPLPLVSSTTPAPGTRRVIFARRPPGLVNERARRQPFTDVDVGRVFVRTNRGVESSSPSPFAATTSATSNHSFASSSPFLVRSDVTSTSTTGVTPSPFGGNSYSATQNGAFVSSPFSSPITQPVFHFAIPPTPATIPMDLDTDRPSLSSFGMGTASTTAANPFGGTPSTYNDGHHQAKRPRQPAQQPALSPFGGGFATSSTSNEFVLSAGFNSLSLGRSAPANNNMGYFGVLGSIHIAAHGAPTSGGCYANDSSNHVQIPRGGGITGHFCPGLTAQDMLFSIGSVVEKKRKPVFQPPRRFLRRRRPRM